ncbi:MAG: FAD-dependent oxidoreductase [Acidobacteriota bacterium]|nr:FAD-dependent oxidoreductase [Acidobacteriota bacterium]
MTVLETPVHVTVIADRCAGCQECVIRCPQGALRMDAATWTVLANDAACVGCRQCERTCPFSAITVEGPLLVAERVDPPLHHPAPLAGNVEETRVGFSDLAAALAEAERCLNCLDPTCVRGCPAHNDIPGFIGAIRTRDVDLAHEILARTTIAPDICSRVCNQSAQCEGACSWSLAGGVPVAIGRLERFVTEHTTVPHPRAGERRDMSIGVIGAGPAGAGAAWDLIEAGCAVTVYERDAAPGGLPVWGMPDFTLPDEVARRPWRQLEAAGVELVLNTEIEASDLDLLLEVHDALVVANGASVPMRLAVPGADSEGVTDATSFLQGAKAALEPGGDVAALLARLGVARGARVLVLGAGNTAMDVARLARRLDLAATCVDWLDERFALARPDELAEARHEGVEVRFTRTVAALHARGGRVARAELARTEQSSSARPPSVLLEDHEFLDVSLVVMAMGYRNDASFTATLAGTPMRKSAPAMADEHWRASGILAGPASAYANHAPVGQLALARESALWAASLANRERLWVVGDALTGPSTVVEAMAQGRRAAAAILDAQPSCPRRRGESDASAPPRVLVCYESEGGRTRAAAETIASQCYARGLDVTCSSIDAVGPKEIAAADFLVVGTWVEGLVLARVRPARAMRAWLEALPRLAGRKVAVFCTYSVNPRGALDEMSRAISLKGGEVVSRESFAAHDLAVTGQAGPSAFAARVAAFALRETSVRVVAH